MLLFMLDILKLYYQVVKSSLRLLLVLKIDLKGSAACIIFEGKIHKVLKISVK